jgi:hypothetical protein
MPVIAEFTVGFSEETVSLDKKRGGDMTGSGEGASVVERLKSRRARHVLIQMAMNGQILEMRCEMPTCYCPHGRKHFDEWPQPRQASELNKWCPNPDHYPVPKKDKGTLVPSNIRLAHVHCNNMDYGWRTRIRAMLEKDPTVSFAQIADTLNGKKSVEVPPPAKAWTAKLVRKVYTS